jgi:solute carrier family 35 protein|tara:strand:+ start:61 stop:1086 length:1026 start_codon:yes stop_codon:yes gene_type:complete
MKYGLPVLVSLYFLSSSALLVLNKIAITVFPNASVLLLAQITSTVAIITVVGRLGGYEMRLMPDSQTIKAYSRVSAVFLSTIYSNFKFIDIAGVNSFIILRCTTPLIVSVLDWLFLNRELPRGQSLISLFGIAIAGTVYANHKVSVGSQAISTVSGSTLAWAVIWLLSFVLDMVYIKHVVDVYKCTGLERTLYQNILAIPILFILMQTPMETSTAHDFFTQGTPKGNLALLLSCLAGTSLSFSGMTLRSELSATAFTVLGIFCKMASSLLNELFVEKERHWVTFGCILLSITCSAFYKQAPERIDVIPFPSSYKTAQVPESNEQEMCKVENTTLQANPDIV